MLYDTIIVGGGASGLFCALNLAKKGQSVALLNNTAELAQKVKISGGGRCNFTNKYLSEKNYICSVANFVKPAIKSYTNHDFIDYINEHKIAYFEKENGQLFTKNSSKDLVSALINDCNKYKVKLFYSVNISNISYKDEVYIIDIQKQTMQARNLVIATGALSFARLGATGFGYEVAKSFKHNIIKTQPSLTGLKLKHPFADLAGVAIEASVTCHKQQFSHNVLFTHQGLSGPAILQISNYWHQGDSIKIDFLPTINIKDYLMKEQSNNAKTTIMKVLRPLLPKAFISQMLEKQFLLSKNIAEISKKDINALADKLHNYIVEPIDTFGFERAEVTLGGVDTKEVNAKTMESKLQDRLFFIGEVLDVTGQLGGYNLQWAWSSAKLAAESIC